WLVRALSMPFREAHAVAAKAVRLAETEALALAELSLDQLQSIDKRITEEIFQFLTVEQSVTSRTSFGGTAPDNVLDAVRHARVRYL
ncbi:MAG: argininosuccinate lyase, partial [Geminicoccaceae bacterium]